MKPMVFFRKEFLNDKKGKLIESGELFFKYLRLLGA